MLRSLKTKKWSPGLFHSSVRALPITTTTTIITNVAVRSPPPSLSSSYCHMRTKQTKTTTSLCMVRRNYRSNSGSSSNNNPRKGPRRQRRPRSPPPPIPPPGSPGRGCFKALIKTGLEVWVVQKADQRSGQETRGVVDRLLTNSPHHPRGIKVMLTSGQVGRVTRIVDDA